MKLLGVESVYLAGGKLWSIEALPPQTDTLLIILCNNQESILNTHSKPVYTYRRVSQNKFLQPNMFMVATTSLGSFQGINWHKCGKENWI